MGRYARGGGACSFDGRHFQVWDSQLGLPDNHVTSITQGTDGAIWFGHLSGAVSFLKHNKIYLFQPAGFANASKISSMAWKHQQLYLATQGNGLYCFAFQPPRTTVRHFTRKDGLNSDTLNQITGKNADQCWLATSQGISLWDMKQNRPLLQAGLPAVAEPINTICQLPDSTLWFGTPEGAIHLDPRNGSAPGKRITKADGLLNANIQKVIADQKGNVWLATEQGIARINQQGVRCFTKPNGLLSDLTYDLLQDREGHLWISQDDGISYFQDVPFELYTQQDGLVNPEVYTILEYEPGSYWIGTAGGISILRPATPPPERFRTLTTRNGLPGNFIYKLFRDSRNNIWIATIGGGIFRYDGRTFRQYGTRQGLKTNNPYFIHCDRNGQVWMGTNMGIDRLDPSSLKVTSFGKREGFIGIETNQNAVFQDQKNDLWFGTVNGLIHASSVAERVPAIPPLVQLNGQRLFFEENNLSPGQRLAHNQNYLTFDFSGISLAYTDKIRYRYQLQGLDARWSPVLAESHARYPNLSAGSYTFVVEAGFPGGKWSQPALFSFVIEPPFWKRGWFILLACSAVVALMSVAYQYRVTHLLKLERMRSKIAIDLHDDIGSALSSISIFSEVAGKQLAQKDPPETTRAIIEKMGHQARAMLDAMDDIVWAVNPRNDHFDELAVRMREFAIPLLEAKNIAFDIHIPEQLLEARLSMEIRKNVFFIFKESVNNLLKHSACSRVRISIQKTGSQLEMVVQDDGKGLPTDLTTRRNGLANMQKRATEIGGSLVISSPDGQGTQIRLTANII